MEEPSFKKTKRKIRCTQEFNQLHRDSLTPSKKSESEKKTSKKNNAFFYLPKVDMDIGSKENYLPNISKKKLSKRKRQNSDIKETLYESNNATSVDGERKDSTEILFKKRIKKKKKIYFEELSKACSNEDLSNIKTGTSVIIDTIQQAKNQNDIEQNNDHIKVPKPRSTLSNLNEHPPRKSMLKTTSKSLSDLALTPIGSDYMSDNVFSDSFKLSETLECNNQLCFPENSNKSDTFELQNSTFDVSQLPVIQSIKKDLSSLGNNGNKRLRSSSCNDENISRNCISVNKRKSVNSIKKRKGTTSISSENSTTINKASLNNVSYSNRKSVRFTEHNDQDSFIIETNNSIIKYRKSPYVRKLPRVSSNNPSVSSEIECNNLSKNRQNLFDISPSGTSTSFNETYETISPTKFESKITKRKKWNRSRSSILDSTGVLHTISPPWDIKDSEDSFNFSYGSNSSLAMNLFDLNCQILQNSPKKKTSNCFTPIKITSTERLDHISSTNENSLRKKSVNIVNSVKQSKSKKSTLKWADSPIEKPSCSKTTIKTDTKKANHGSSNKKTKMPNFALIHQKALDKLENVKEMTERKALRSKLLLSGRKPDMDNLEVKSPGLKIKKSPKSKKMLRFIPKRISPDKKKEHQATSSTKTSTSTSNSKIIIDKPLKNKLKSHIPKLTKKPLEDQKKVFTKVSLKLGTKEKKLKQDQINVVANKIKGVRNSLEHRRDAVKNVRSNRRFELLMNMRKGKK